MGQLNDLKGMDFVDLDAIFRPVTDKDYDLASGGVTRERFLQNYHEWIKCCNDRRAEHVGQIYKYGFKKDFRSPFVYFLILIVNNVLFFLIYDFFSFLES